MDGPGSITFQPLTPDALDYAPDQDWDHVVGIALVDSPWPGADAFRDLIQGTDLKQQIKDTFYEGAMDRLVLSHMGERVES